MRSSKKFDLFVLGGVLAVVTLFAAVGCGSDASGAPQAATPTQGAQAPTRIAKPILAVTDLIVGPNRFVFGLADSETGQPITDTPQLQIQFFKINSDGTGTKLSDADPVLHNENLPAFLWVAHTTFTEAGHFGALITVMRTGQAAYQTKLEFDVVVKSGVPRPGDPVPASRNMTIKDDPTLDNICSASPHDDMHTMTIADALKSGKPTVILFAAPGFCPSFTCGPDMEVMQKLESKYRAEANFIHIESPNTIQNHTHTLPVDPHHREQPGHMGVLMPQIQTAGEWGLVSEPWIFVVDKAGILSDRFEGGLTYDEVDPAVAKVTQ